MVLRAMRAILQCCMLACDGDTFLQTGASEGLGIKVPGAEDRAYTGMMPFGAGEGLTAALVSH